MRPDQAVGFPVDLEPDVFAIDKMLADQRFAVEFAVGRGVVAPVFSETEFGVQAPLIAGVIPSGILRGDFQGEIGDLAHLPDAVGVAVVDVVKIHIEGYVAVGGHELSRKALAIVDEGVAADGDSGLIFEIPAQRGYGVDVITFLVESVGQGHTVRFGIKDAILVVEMRELRVDFSRQLGGHGVPRRRSGGLADSIAKAPLNPEGPK